MDGHLGIGLALLAGSLALLALVAAVEAGVVSTNRARVRLLAPRPWRAGAEALQAQLKDRSALLTALLLARNIALVSASAIGVFLLTRRFGSDWVQVIVVVAAAVAIAGLIQSALLMAASRSPERWGVGLAGVTALVWFVFGPLAAAFRLPVRAILALPFVRKALPEEASEEDELLRLVEIEEANGGIEAEEREMIRGIIHLEDTAAREIMVPRIDIAAVDVTASLSEVLNLIVERGFSRIPLYEGTVDKVVGVLYAKDLVRYLAERKQPPRLTDVARPAYFVPETKRVDELLAEMRQSKVHMAIVVDEYGGTAGLVTIEDLLEEIVGEIEDEYDRSEVTILRVSDDEAVLDARVPVDELNEMFGVRIEGEDFDTVGGFVYHLLGRMPTPGDEVSADGLTLRVLSVLGHRMKKIRVTRQPQAEGEEDDPVAIK